MNAPESINGLTLSPQVEARLQELETRRREGRLSPGEQNELDVLKSAQGLLAEIRAKAQARHDAPMSSRPARTVRNGLPVMQVPAGTPAIDPVTVRRFLDEQAF